MRKSSNKPTVAKVAKMAREVEKRLGVAVTRIEWLTGAWLVEALRESDIRTAVDDIALTCKANGWGCMVSGRRGNIIQIG